MGRETYHDAILVLEKKIEEYEKAIIELKRVRNSLLNVSTLLPPEILGKIFRWSIARGGDFDGLPKGSYNFLLVCHHWFEVASNTQELWCFWGNSTSDWTHRHPRCKTGPLDLVLEGCGGSGLSDELRDALQDHAAQDNIRRVHLTGFFAAKLLNSVLSSIVTEGEATRSNGVESFRILQSSGGSDVVDVSDFFSRYHLQKLKYLRLVGCRISSWGLLVSRTAALTTLELADILSPITPTLSQLLSILSSNPLLQDLKLSYHLAPPVIDGEWSSPLVPLRHLKKFHLTSDFGHASGLLNQLELPDRMERLRLDLRQCSALDLSQILGPYIGDCVRRRGRFPGCGLGLSTSHTSHTFLLHIVDAPSHDDFSMVAWFMMVDIVMSGALKKEEAEQTGLDLITHIPREQVVSLQTALPILRSELCVEMRDLTYLHLIEVDLSTWFVEPDIRGPHIFKELLPSLDRILIVWSTLSGDDGWSPFTNFLSRRAAAGNRISSLRLCRCPPIDDDVVETIKCAVKTFENEDSFGDGP